MQQAQPPARQHVVPAQVGKPERGGGESLKVRFLFSCKGKGGVPAFRRKGEPCSPAVAYQRGRTQPRARADDPDGAVSGGRVSRSEDGERSRADGRQAGAGFGQKIVHQQARADAVARFGVAEVEFKGGVGQPGAALARDGPGHADDEGVRLPGSDQRLSAGVHQGLCVRDVRRLAAGRARQRQRAFFYGEASKAAVGAADVHGQQRRHGQGSLCKREESMLYREAARYAIGPSLMPLPSLSNLLL